MIEQRPTSHHHRSLEVGGSAGIRINSSAPAVSQPPMPAESPSAALRLVARHPRLLMTGLLVVGVAALIGPLISILVLELPLWLMIAPLVSSLIAFGSAIAVGRGSLTSLSRACAQPELEGRILELAGRMGGRLTVALTARQLALSLAEAEHALMTLARAGHVDIDNDPESAAVIYVFRDFDAQLHPLGARVGSRSEPKRQ